MHALAVVPVVGAEERLETALGRILGRSVYDVRARLQNAEHPVVVTSFADRAAAEDAQESLAAYGFETHLLGPRETESDTGRFLVRHFELQSERLCAEDAGGERREIPYREIELLLRGTWAVTTSRLRTVEKRKFSPLRMVLTAGLSTTRTTKMRLPVEQEAREGFLHAYAPGSPPLVFRESRLLYTGLGADLERTGLLNFLRTQGEIQDRCSQALYDERLLTRATQAHILGPSLPPARHLDLAISLLARVLRRPRVS